jgi:glutamine synthetase type III
MPNAKIELNENEQIMIVKGLDRLVQDVEKVSASAERMSMDKADKEIKSFKQTIIELIDKVRGQKKIV